MHEWSLAEAVLETLTSLLEREETKRVSEVEIICGEIMELDLDVFRFALEELSKGTHLEGSKFILREEKVVFRCNSCGYDWGFERVHDLLPEELGIREGTNGSKESPIHFIPDLAQALMRCPNCGSRDFEAESGRGLRIHRVVLEG